MITKLISYLTLITFANCSPTKVERMTMSKMRMADLETSASGYEYNEQQGLPVTYVRYTNHENGRYYDAPTPVHYVVATPVAPVAHIPETPTGFGGTVLPYAKQLPEIAQYVVQQPYTKGETANYGAVQLPKYTTPLDVTKTNARAPYYDPEEFQNKGNLVIQKRHGDHNGNDDGTEEDESEEKDESYEKENDDDDKSKEFEVGSGSKYDGNEYSEQGEKGDKGYKKYDEFNKGEKGDYGKKGEKGYYSEESGNKKSHDDEAENYGNHEESEHDHKDTNYGHSSYHKKGQKTTGFHNVYHKDEYKKDTDFYDVAHKDGQFEKHGSSDKHHENAEGDFEKGGGHHSGFENQEKGEKGNYDKGNYKNHDEGYKSEEGKNSYYQDNSDYATKNEKEASKKHGYDYEN